MAANAVIIFAAVPALSHAMAWNPLAPALAQDAAPNVAWLLRVTTEAAAIALLVLIIQTAAGRWLTPAWRHRLWFLVVVRLILPVTPASSMSLWNFTRAAAATASSRLISNTDREHGKVPASAAPPASAGTGGAPSVSIRYEFDRARFAEGTPDHSAAMPTATSAIGRAGAATPGVEPAAFAPTIPNEIMILAAVWLGVAVLLLARLFVANILFARRLRRGERVTDPALLALLAQTSHEVGLSNPPPLLVTDAVRSPATAGVWRPMLLVPRGLLESLSVAEQRAVLLHELAHVRCHDVAVNWLLAILQAFHWFNPFIWFAFSRLRAEREVARDAMVLGITSSTESGGDESAARAYARTLLMLAERMSTAVAGGPGGGTVVALAGRASTAGIVGEGGQPFAAGLFGRGPHLHQRLKMITRFRTNARGLTLLGPVLFLAIGCGALTSPKRAAPVDAGAPPAQTAVKNLPTLGDDAKSRDEVVTSLAEQGRAGQPLTVKVAGPLTSEASLAIFDNFAVRFVYCDIRGPGSVEQIRHIADQMLRSKKSRDAFVGNFPSPVDVVPRSSAARPETIEMLTADARELARRALYAEALSKVDLILARDPKNDYATGVRPLLRDRIDLQQSRTSADLNRADERRVGGPDGERRNVTREDTELRAALDKKVPEINLQEVPLDEAIARLREISGANIFVNWKAIERAGVDRTKTISVRLYNIKFAKALDIILQSASGPERKARLEYTIDEGVITISTPEDLSKNVLTRVYDIRDLIQVIPNFDDAPDLRLRSSQAATAPALPAPPPTLPATRPASRAATRPREVEVQARVDAIIKLIKEIVAPDSWDGESRIGAIKELSGQLVVTQLPENHAALNTLLEQLRAQRNIQITIEARYLSCDDRIVAKLLAQWQKTAPTTGPAASGVFLSEMQVSELLRVAQESEEISILAAPRMTVVNGQRAYVMIGSQTPYIQDFVTIKGATGELRYEPVIGYVDSGLVLDATATASANRKQVTLTLRPQVSTLEGMAEKPWPGRPAGSNLVIQTPRVRGSELRTTVSIPNGGTILLGGMEDPGISGALATRPATQPADAATHPVRPGHRLYLLAKPQLIVQTEVEQRQFPLLNTRRGEGSEKEPRTK
jgi:beta-lactamase regulating signal transducer with metallopeptidase domain